MKRQKPSPNEYCAFISDYYLAIRPRTEKELRTYLGRKFRTMYPDVDATAIIDPCIEHLVAEGRIDDSQFAKWYVEEMSELKLRGPVRVRMELQRKGIKTDLIDAELRIYEGRACEAAHTLLRTTYRNRSLHDQKERQKVIHALMRRGFTMQQIKNAIEEYTSGE